MVMLNERDMYADAKIYRILDKIPNTNMREAVQYYLLEGIPMGGFMKALFSNNLVDAYNRADSWNSAVMHLWADWLYNHCPREAWGSEDKMKAYMAKVKVQK